MAPCLAILGEGVRQRMVDIKTGSLLYTNNGNQAVFSALSLLVFHLLIE